MAVQFGAGAAAGAQVDSSKNCFFQGSCRGWRLDAVRARISYRVVARANQAPGLANAVEMTVPLL